MFKCYSPVTRDERIVLKCNGVESENMCIMEWIPDIYYSKRIIIVRWADLSDFSSFFVEKKCIFVSRPMKIVTCLKEKR